MQNKKENLYRYFYIKFSLRQFLKCFKIREEKMQNKTNQVWNRKFRIKNFKGFVQMRCLGLRYFIKIIKSAQYVSIVSRKNIINVQ
jgi:hypothetical protein